MPKIPNAKNIKRKQRIRAISQVSLVERNSGQNSAASRLALDVERQYKPTSKYLAETSRKIAVARRFAAMQQAGFFERVKKRQQKQ